MLTLTPDPVETALKVPALERTILVRVRRVLFAGSGTILGSSAGFVLPFLVASWFGAGRATDAYFFAVGSIVFATTILSLVVEGVIVPFAVERRALGRDAIRQFTRRVAAQAGLLSLLWTAALLLLVRLALLPHLAFDSDQAERITAFFLIMLPLPALSSVNSTLAGCHFAFHRYALPTSTVALRAVGGLVVGIMFRGSLGLNAVALGLVAGELVRLAILSVSMQRMTRTLPAEKASPQAKLVSFWRTAGPQVLSMLIVGANPLIDKAFAAGLRPGSVTVLELAEKLFYVPMTIMISSVGAVSGAAWSELAVAKERTRLRTDYWRTQAIASGLAAVAAALGCICIWLAVSKAAKALGFVEPTLIALTVTLFFIGLPFATVQELGVRLCVAHRVTRLLPAFALISLLLNLVGNFLGARYFGVPGLALASTAIRAVQACICLMISVTILRAPAPESGL